MKHHLSFTADIIMVKRCLIFKKVNIGLDFVFTFTTDIKPYLGHLLVTFIIKGYQIKHKCI